MLTAVTDYLMKKGGKGESNSGSVIRGGNSSDAIISKFSTVKDNDSSPLPSASKKLQKAPTDPPTVWITLSNPSSRPPQPAESRPKRRRSSGGESSDPRKRRSLRLSRELEGNETATSPERSKRSSPRKSPETEGPSAPSMIRIRLRQSTSNEETTLVKEPAVENGGTSGSGDGVNDIKSDIKDDIKTNAVNGNGDRVRSSIASLNSSAGLGGSAALSGSTILNGDAISSGSAVVNDGAGSSGSAVSNDGTGLSGSAINPLKLIKVKKVKADQTIGKVGRKKKKEKALIQEEKEPLNQEKEGKRAKLIKNGKGSKKEKLFLSVGKGGKEEKLFLSVGKGSKKEKLSLPVGKGSLSPKRRYRRFARPEDDPLPKTDIVNNEFCTACSTGGTLICCESCPKSFHFTCADPPIDPDNVPDENWFCNECRAKANPHPEPTEQINSIAGIWDLLLEKSRGINPRTFTIPKRIKNLNSSVDDEDGVKKGRPSERVKSKAIDHPEHVEERISEGSKLTFTQNKNRHRERISEEGYCHICNKSSTPLKLLIRCDSCSLLWHLDCLPYPLAVFPSSTRHWSCPVHLTAENLGGIFSAHTLEKALRASNVNVHIDDWRQSMSVDLPVLPESSVRLQFGWSPGSVSFPNQSVGCAVPESVRKEYERLRELPIRQIRLDAYYDHYSYVERGVETNLVI